MPWLITIAALLACSQEPVCVDLRPHPEFANHVQTYEIALDPERRRVYSSALGSRVLLAYDADTHEILQDLPLGVSPLTTPDVEVDLGGNVWVVANSAPPITRFDRSTGERTILWDDLQGGRDLVARAAGGVVVLGRSESSNNVLVAYDGSGQRVATVELEFTARGLVPMDGYAGLGVTVEGDELLIIDSADLIELSRCPTAMQRPWHGAQLDDGSVVLASEGSIGIACVDQPVVWRVGEENMEVLSLGDHALVLDRVGAEPGFDANQGIGRLVDAGGVFASYATAKNTGFGVLDPQTGLVWVNSEGSSEVLPMDPATGAFVDAIRGGTFLDGLVVDPLDNTLVYASGRLSDTLVRIQDAEVTAQTHALRWPYSPALDLQRDLLWVLSHTESTLHAVDRVDLSLQRSIDPGLGSNSLLSFGNIMIHTGRGTLFFAESQRDVLLELDPDSGQELRRWDLGGPLIDDPDQVGELALREHPASGLVYLARSNDARVQRVDPDDQVVQTVFLPSDVSEALSVGHRTDFMRIFPDEGLLFVGGKAVGLDDLSRRADRDLPITRIAGQHPSKAHQWIAVDDAKRNIVRIDQDGEVLGQLTFARHQLYATVFQVCEDEHTVTMTRALHGMVCSFPMSALR